MLRQILLPVVRTLTAAWVGRVSAAGALFPLYHVTPYCNLACSYCEGFPEVGVSRLDACGPTVRGQDRRQLDTPEVERLLSILRRRFDSLFLTGGEPLVRHDIDHVVATARALGFRRVAINTNGTLLHEHDPLMDLCSAIVLSLDTLEDPRDGTAAGKSGQALAAIVDNVRRYAAQQERRRFKLIVHTVVLPGHVDLAEQVVRFALECGAWVCVSPLQQGYRVPDRLAESAEYRSLIDTALAMKAAGRRISGSVDFYRCVRDLTPYRCQPFIIPRILPNGHLLYPCRPQGVVGGSILELGSWEAAVREAQALHGPIRPCDRSCRIRCYIEPSLMISRPWRAVTELRR